MISRDQLLQILDQELNSKTIADYCPNGLQVEGKSQIKKIVTGVTASQALIEQAVTLQADALIVHHGYFWKGESAVVTGMKKRRLQLLLQHDINLFAYHLPLDVHLQLGNNAQLGQLWQLQQIEPLATVAPVGVVQVGHCAEAVSLDLFAQRIALSLGRTPMVHDAGIGLVRQVAWCSGGGQGYIEAAAAAGVQLFISGEVSEQTIHVANELGIHFIAAGHHATERFGVRALGQWLQRQYALDVEFVDIFNPA